MCNLQNRINYMGFNARLFNVCAWRRFSDIQFDCFGLLHLRFFLFLPWNKFTAMFQQKKTKDLFVFPFFSLNFSSGRFFSVWFFLPACRICRSEKKGIRPVHSTYYGPPPRKKYRSTLWKSK